MVVNEKLAKKILVGALLGTLGFTSIGFSAAENDADVEGTLVEPMTGVLPNFYSMMQLRQYTSVALDKNATQGTNVFGQARYILGSTFMNGKMDANVTFGVVKNTQTNLVVQRRTYLWMSYSALTLSNLAVTPYADIRLPIRGSGTAAKLGMNFAAKKMISTGFGMIKLRMGADVVSHLNSRQSQSTVKGLTDEDKVRFSLTGDEQDQVDTAAAPITTEYDLSIFVGDVAKVKGLALRFSAYVDRNFAANMEKAVVGGEEKITMTGYSAKNTAFNLYKIGYTARNGVSIENETYQNFNGVYEFRVNGSDAAVPDQARWTNIIKVTTTL